MIEAALALLLLIGFVLLTGGTGEKKRSPAPSTKPKIIDSEDYQLDAIADLTCKLSDDAKRRLIKQLARSLKRSKLTKVR